jgi:DNA-binding NtrC family response regulator
MSDLKHVLIVENDGNIRDLLAMALREFGYRVSMASDGIAARGILATSMVDLLLADVIMPGEMGQHLAEHAKTLGVPSLLMSGEPVTKEALKDNHAFIGKPFKLRQLSEQIVRALATVKAQQCAAGFVASEGTANRGVSIM